MAEREILRSYSVGSSVGEDRLHAESISLRSHDHRQKHGGFADVYSSTVAAVPHGIVEGVAFAGGVMARMSGDLGAIGKTVSIGIGAAYGADLAMRASGVSNFYAQDAYLKDGLTLASLGAGLIAGPRLLNLNRGTTGAEAANSFSHGIIDGKISQWNAGQQSGLGAAGNERIFGGERLNSGFKGTLAQGSFRDAPRLSDGIDALIELPSGKFVWPTAPSAGAPVRTETSSVSAAQSEENRFAGYGDKVVDLAARRRLAEKEVAAAPGESAGFQGELKPRSVDRISGETERAEKVGTMIADTEIAKFPVPKQEEIRREIERMTKELGYPEQFLKLDQTNGQVIYDHIAHEHAIEMGLI